MEIAMTKFFGFAIADSMFSGDVTISRKELTAEEVAKLLEAEVQFCLNPSHVATIVAAKSRYGFKVEIPEKPPVVALTHGDELIVMGVRGLPRLTDRHEYTEEEIAKATFNFSIYSVA